MKSWYASYEPGQGASPVEATVLASEKKISIGFRRDEAPVVLHWDTRHTTAVFEQHLQSTRLTNTDNPHARLKVAGKDAFEFISGLEAERSKPWHRKERSRDWMRNSLLLAGIAGAMVLAYFLLVPWLAGKVATTVSVDTEEQFGDAIYNALALSRQEDAGATAVVNDFFRELNITSGYTIRVTVVKGEIANAFALPGGHIVVYTGLLNQLKTYPELAALLSHEYTHVNNQHATKSIFRRLGSRVFFGLLLGKTGSVTAVLADQADNLKSLTYSRSLEKEADLEGLGLLKERKIDPDGFVQLLEHLKQGAPADGMPEFLASHPDIGNRIAYIRSAAAGSAVEQHIRLKAIFDQLKQTP